MRWGGCGKRTIIVVVVVVVIVAVVVVVIISLRTIINKKALSLRSRPLSLLRKNEKKAKSEKRKKTKTPRWGSRETFKRTARVMVRVRVFLD